MNEFLFDNNLDDYDKPPDSGIKCSFSIQNKERGKF